MNAIPLLLIIIVLLLIYIVLFPHSSHTAKNEQKDTAPGSVKPVSIIGTTKTSFPSEGTQGKPEEADKNSKANSPTFAPESRSDNADTHQKEEEENEFNPMPPENEVDEDEVAKEDLSILLDEEIESSDESLMAREIRMMQQSVENYAVTDKEKKALQKTVIKLRGSDFLEKLQKHEQIQRRIHADFMRLIAGEQESTPETDIRAGLPQEDWTSFL